LFKTYFNIIFPATPWSPKWCLSFRFNDHNLYLRFLFHSWVFAFHKSRELLDYLREYKLFTRVYYLYDDDWLLVEYYSTVIQCARFLTLPDLSTPARPFSSSQSHHSSSQRNVCLYCQTSPYTSIYCYFVASISFCKVCVHLLELPRSTFLWSVWIYRYESIVTHWVDISHRFVTTCFFCSLKSFGLLYFPVTPPSDLLFIVSLQFLRK
jgi:hypothetical protein